MAKFELKFISNDDDYVNIQVKSEDNQIIITTTFECDNDSLSICLDKSTAIKFAKTLRTEINKIESEVNNGNL